MVLLVVNVGKEGKSKISLIYLKGQLLRLLGSG